MAMLQIAPTQTDLVRPATVVPVRRVAGEPVTARVLTLDAVPNAHARQRSLVQASLLLYRRD
jgi:hypothetical protein